MRRIKYRELLDTVSKQDSSVHSSGQDSRIIVVGAGNIGLRLLKNLPRELSLVLLDRDTDQLQQAGQLRDDLKTLQGDASSRLVLEQLQLTRQDTVVLTTTTEKVTLEVARLLREGFEAGRILALAITQKGWEQLQTHDVEVVDLFNAGATMLRNRLQHSTKAVEGIGLGKNEILEVEVHPHSRLAHRTLEALEPWGWRAGIIYRQNEIISPTGTTRLLPRDRVVVLGEPGVVKTVAEMFSFRFSRFPMEYGDTLLAYMPPELPEAYLEELVYLLQWQSLQRILFVARRQSDALSQTLTDLGQRLGSREVWLHLSKDNDPLAACLQAAQPEGRRIGMVFLPGTVVAGGWSRGSLKSRKSVLRQLMATLGAPLMLARGSYPYDQAVVPGFCSAGLGHGLQVVLEMQANLACSVHLALVQPPKYTSTPQEQEAFSHMQQAGNRLAMLYKAPVEQQLLRGNPVTVLRDYLQGVNLLVTDIDSWQQRHWWQWSSQPDAAWRVFKQAPVSAMLLPGPETAV